MKKLIQYFNGKYIHCLYNDILKIKNTQKGVGNSLFVNRSCVQDAQCFLSPYEKVRIVFRQPNQSSAAMTKKLAL